tara:strand:+ start:4169 stop:4705 length:537 start_codon:yes stop_codon:yes gene_type:complete
MNNKLTFSYNATNREGYCWNVRTNEIINPYSFMRSIFRDLGKKSSIVKNNKSICRFDLSNSKEVISIDFVIREEIISRGVKNSFHMKGNSHEGVWGNRWIIGLDTLTVKGERNQVYEFILEQPMISRFSCEKYKNLDNEKIESIILKIHIDELEKRVLECYQSMYEFISHYIHKLEIS